MRKEILLFFLYKAMGKSNAVRSKFIMDISLTEKFNTLSGHNTK